MAGVVIVVQPMRELLRRITSRLGPIFQSDASFIEAAYQEILGRKPDRDGFDHYRRVLRQGSSRTAVLLELMRSQESVDKLTRPAHILPDLRSLRPDRYRKSVDITNGQTVDVFDAVDPSDFDWLETAIVKSGYYEQPGVWTLSVDTDKRVMAEMVASFEPQRPLELGCAAGAVIQCLEEIGILADGVDISTVAVAKASPAVRARIHVGDLLTLDLPRNYDLLYGLDVFEHLNPNRLGEVLTRIAAVLADKCYVFCNIPAFGQDEIFGTVFPLYLRDWDAQSAQVRPLSALHVDELGYPVHGHLICADSSWWVRQFETVGFKRETAIESAFHLKYDSYFLRHSLARKAFYVLSRGTELGDTETVVRTIEAHSSLALKD